MIKIITGLMGSVVNIKTIKGLEMNIEELYRASIMLHTVTCTVVWSVGRSKVLPVLKLMVEKYKLFHIHRMCYQNIKPQLFNLH